MELLALEFYSEITGIDLNHFYVKYLKSQLELAVKNNLKYNYLKKVKRFPEEFRSIIKEMDGFMVTFDEMIRFYENTLNVMTANDNNNDKFIDHLFRKGRFIVIKTKNFCENIEKFVCNYGDLVYPILSASSKVNFFFFKYLFLIF